MSRTDPPRLAPASIRSPCVQVCTLHPDGSHCLGCFRTSAEIGAWSSMSDAERDAVMQDLDRRRAARREQRRRLRAARRAGG